MSKYLFLVVCLFLVSDITLSAQDIVVLKNNNVIEGEAIETSNGLVVKLKRQNTQLMIPYEEIRSINGISSDSLIGLLNKKNSAENLIQQRARFPSKIAVPTTILIKKRVSETPDIVFFKNETTNTFTAVQKFIDFFPTVKQKNLFAIKQNLIFDEIPFAKIILKTGEIYLVSEHEEMRSKPYIKSLTKLPYDVETYFIAHQLMHLYYQKCYPTINEFLEKGYDNFDKALVYYAIEESDAVLFGIECFFSSSEIYFPNGYIPLDLLKIAPKHFSEERFKEFSPFLYERTKIAEEYAIKFLRIAKFLGGVKTLNRVISNPPISSEQLLHPEKYFLTFDTPVLFNQEKIEKLFEKIIHKGTLGEIAIQVLLSYYSQPKEASEGWDGDFFIVAEKNGDKFLFWITVWDTNKDAEEFANSLKEIFRSDNILNKCKISTNNDIVILAVDSQIDEQFVKEVNNLIIREDGTISPYKVSENKLNEALKKLGNTNKNPKTDCTYIKFSTGEKIEIVELTENEVSLKLSQGFRYSRSGEDTLEITCTSAPDLKINFSIVQRRNYLSTKSLTLLSEIDRLISLTETEKNITLNSFEHILKQNFDYLIVSYLNKSELDKNTNVFIYSNFYDYTFIFNAKILKDEYKAFITVVEKFLDEIDVRLKK